MIIFMDTTIAVRLPEDLKKKLEKKRAEMSKKMGARVSISLTVRALLAEALA